jgi:hypothetical protein
VMLKNMSSGNQEEVNFEKLLTILQNNW